MACVGPVLPRECGCGDFPGLGPTVHVLPYGAWPALQCMGVPGRVLPACTLEWALCVVQWRPGVIVGCGARVPAPERTSNEPATATRRSEPEEARHANPPFYACSLRCTQAAGSTGKGPRKRFGAARAAGTRCFPGRGAGCGCGVAMLQGPVRGKWSVLKGVPCLSSRRGSALH